MVGEAGRPDWPCNTQGDSPRFLKSFDRTVHAGIAACAPADFSGIYGIVDPCKKLDRLEFNMGPIPYTRLRNELARVLDKVNEDRSSVVITRRNGKSAVLMSMDEYSALQETAHLLRSPRNAARLHEAGEQVEKEIARHARRR